MNMMLGFIYRKYVEELFVIRKNLTKNYKKDLPALKAGMQSRQLSDSFYIH